jgi:lysophospholipase L1-like esterase
MKTAYVAVVLFTFASVAICACSDSKPSSQSTSPMDPPPPANWVGTWATGLQATEPRNLPTPADDKMPTPDNPGFAGNTLRQIVHVTMSGSKLRLRLSNEYGVAPVTLESVHVAKSMGGGAIDTATDLALAFTSIPSVTIAPGQSVYTDVFPFALPALSDLAITIKFGAQSKDVTGHPGSRTTSYLQMGDAVAKPSLPDAIKTAHWYFISELDVEADEKAGAIVILGDSLTDGRGSTTDGNDRWPDALARRLQAIPATANVAVLNLGIGGNALLNSGIGPTGKSRFDHDVRGMAGVKWFIVLEGVNDIGPATSDLSNDLIAAYQEMVNKAHQKGIKAFGATILPFKGNGYAMGDHLAQRQKVNDWIRSPGNFDAVVDLDAAVRDPADPDKLDDGFAMLPASVGTDYLHLNPAGYRAMADAVDLNLFGAADAGKPTKQPPLSHEGYVSNTAEAGAFPLVASGAAAPIVVAGGDFPGVLRVVTDLSADIQRVTQIAPAVVNDTPPVTARNVVLVGTLGKSPLIDGLVASNKIDVSEIKGKWESFVIQGVDQPIAGVDHALVIAGSDQRGTIFGAYDVSTRIGVSPWYWWDDVPPKHAGALWVKSGRYGQGSPAVKYRGFFINDENPSTGTWAPKLFGPGLASIKRSGATDPSAYTSGLNHYYWERVFEVALRLKANYIWPAVWGRAFADDDKDNHATATRYGVVMGTSHEAPMLRGIEEWNRRVVPTQRANAGIDDTVTTQGKDDFSATGNGEWRYSTNAESLRAYWREGIQRVVDQKIEGVVTLGMRGPGDIKLPADTGTELVNKIITDQRQIIQEVTGADPSKLPQVWTLYKEVQDWWDKGLRVPDDVTVVWCDDNWGNLRALPDLTAMPRAGGYGIYYHFDYVGGGRNYKWVDTNLLPNLWEQLNLAYSYGADRLWMFNVGDMKGNEVPLQFAMDYAWNPRAFGIERLPEWESRWAAQQFGDDVADSIADVVRTYERLQSDRKPELLNRRITLDPTKDPTDPSAIIYSDSVYFTKDASGMLPPPEMRTYVDHNPFSLSDYDEMEQVVADWKDLAARSELARQALPQEAQDAYYELVDYAVKASANLYELRLAEYKNILYAAQGRASTNDQANIAQARFADDQAMSDYYNLELAGGKWSGWQTQPHIGYGDQDRYGANAPWQQPQLNELAIPDAFFPALVSLTPPTGAALGVAIDGSDKAWTSTSTDPAVLPTFSPFQTQSGQYIDVFSRGSGAFDYTITVEAPPGISNGNEYKDPWIFVRQAHGRLDTTTKEVRADIVVDWPHAPTTAESVDVTFTVSATDDAKSTVKVKATIQTPKLTNSVNNRFVEANGVVSMEAEHYSRMISDAMVSWKRIPDIGRTGAGMTPTPPTAKPATPGGATPHLEYDLHLFGSGDIKVWAYLSPRNSVLHNGGLRYGVSIDDGPIQTVNINAGEDLNGGGNRPWERHTSDNVNLTSTAHHVDAGGAHVLKIWMIDPTVIVQKLVVDLGGMRPSYFGPPESYRTAP